jgi:excisionase family DNA binding protein
MYKNFNNYPDILNVSEIQDLLGIGRKQAYELIHSGEFNVTRIGTRIKVSKSNLLKWIEGRNYNGEKN